MRIFTFVALLSVTAVLAACNTVKGVGRDIQDSGEMLEDVAS